MNLQQLTDSLFLEFVKDPRDKEKRQKYKANLNALADKFPEDVKKAFGYRKDVRTLGDFALEIYDQTAINEKKCFNFWNDGFSKNHFNETDFISSGIDQDGKLIWNKSSSKDEGKSPDYFCKKNNFYLEIKYSPCHFKNTFKTSDFLHYNKLGNTYVLSVTCRTFTPSFFEGAFNHYVLITPEQIKNICEDIENSKLLQFPCKKEYGGKPGIQFYFCEEQERITRISKGSLSETAVHYSNYFELGSNEK